MSVFLSVDETANLIGVTKQAVQKNCKAGKYTTRQVTGRGGLRYEIALTSLPETAQARYHELRFNQQVEKFYEQQQTGNHQANAFKENDWQTGKEILSTANQADSQPSNTIDGDCGARRGELHTRLHSERIHDNGRNPLRHTGNLATDNTNQRITRNGLSGAGQGIALANNAQGQNADGVSDVPAARPDTTYSETTERQRRIGLARQVIFRFIEGFDGSEAAAVRYINQHYATGNLPSALLHALKNCNDKPRKNAPANADILPHKTVQNWKQRKAETGSYLPKKKQKDYSVKDWHAPAIALYCRKQKPCLTSVAEKIATVYPHVTYAMLYEFFTEKYSQGDIIKGQNAGQALRAKQAYKTRTSAGLEPWDIIHSDGMATHFTAPHPIADDYVTLEVWDAHDVATRYVPPLAIGLRENFEVIAKCFELAIRDNGVPFMWQTDSTKIVKNNKKFTGCSLTSIADRAGIEIYHPTTVGNAQANGISENFHTYLDKESRELATYQSKKMDSLTFRGMQKLTKQFVKAQSTNDAQEIDRIRRDIARVGKGLFFETYQQAVDWLEEKRQKWNNSPHSALKKIRDELTSKLRHQTPNEALAEWKSAGGWQPRYLDGMELIDLFLPRKICTVYRGIVTPYAKMQFRHQDLDHYEGEKVLVAYDSMDYSQVWVMDLKQRLICTAPHWANTPYVAQTALDSSKEKNAMAQIRRREKDIAGIKKQLGGSVIDSSATVVTPLVFASAPEKPVLTTLADFYLENAKEETPKTPASESWLSFWGEVKNEEEEAEQAAKEEVK